MTTVERLSAALSDRYRIERELGAGGMATVYLADDLRHRRKVAIKVLRPELAASLGPDRFLREIEVAAQLTHPHILPLHDSGAVDGFLFYVMPYIDGESLRTRLDRVGELPITEAVRILREVADALSHAHALGVVHRDIKPDNVMLSGRHALVMDFGVAKAVSEATGRNALTTAGVALGTPTYMAPEQAAADPHLDHRVDIYAVGAMGYELLAGRPPFTGRTPQEVLGMHVTQAPDPVDRYRPGAPPALVEIIMRCLAKRPSDRWQSADELVERLEPLATPSGGITPTTTRPHRGVAVPRARRTWIVAGLAFTVVLGAVGIGALADRGPEPLVLGRRTQITIAPGLELDPALSPDGKLIAYASGTATETRIYVRQVEGGTPVEVALDGEGLQRAPQWSPDGSSLLFTTLQGIFRVPALGGIPQLVASSGPEGPGQIVDAVWSPDGGSIAYVRRDSVVVHDLVSGAERSIVGGLGLFLPAWSPDGRWIAVTQGAVGFVYAGRFLGDLAPARIILVPAAGGEPIEIAGGGSLNIDPTWRTSRELLFVSNREGARDIYRQLIGSDGQPDGPPLRLTTGLNVHTVSIAADGSLLAYATFVETVNIWSLPSAPGAEPVLRQVTAEQQIIEGFDISSDGRWLVFDSNRDGSQRIFRTPLAGGPVQRLTEGTWDDFLPRFSPDDRRIAFHSYRFGERKLFSVSPDGGAVTQLTTWPGQHLQADWAPDGNALVYEHRLNRISSIRVAYDGGGAWADSVTLGEVSGNPAAGNARFSPDGRFVSFADNGTIRVVPARGGPERTAFARSDAFATLATWAPAGATLFVFALDSGGSSLWEAALGGEPRRVAVFDDPNRQPTRYGLVAHSNAVYFTMGARQADISVVALDRAE